MNTNNKKTQPKKVLIVTEEWLAPSLALNIQNEGHEVLLAEKRHTDILKGTIKKIPFADRMKYAAKMDLVIYEDKSHHGEPTELRKRGISVLGPDKNTDRLELDRTWGNKMAEMCGVMVPELFEIDDFDQVREIIKERGGKWVLKQQGKLDEIKGLNFVAKLDDSKDLLDFLDILEKQWVDGLEKDFVLQEKVEGHEFAVGSYWNGTEFMKDKDGDELCIESWEHKPLFPGNMGEATGEQYTVIHYRKAKESKLFQQTVGRCRPILQRMDFRGYFDINSIVTDKGAYFLEFTPRMGVPLTSGELEIQKSGWYDFLKAMADGTQDPNYAYDPDYCIVSWLYTKPFPFRASQKLAKIYEDSAMPTNTKDIAELMTFRMSNSNGIVVNFKPDFTLEDWKHIHPDAILYKDGQLRVANADGYVLTATAMDADVSKAGEKLNKLLSKIVVPKGFWRNDFDDTNYHHSKEDLEKWGYLPKG